MCPEKAHAPPNVGMDPLTLLQAGVGVGCESRVQCSPLTPVTLFFGHLDGDSV